VGRALGEPEAQRDLALAAVLLEPEAEGLTNLAHRDPLSWHGITPGKGRRE